MPTSEEIIEREQTTIRLPKELKEELKQEAEKKGLPFNAYILKIFESYINYQK